MTSARIAGLLSAVTLLLACCAPKPGGPITTSFDGVYKGTGYSTSPPDWGCPATMPDDTMNVSGGYATFMDVHGWVAPDGTAQMSSQTATLPGRFQNTHFEGLLQYHERGSDRLTCGYTLKLDRAG